jgi:hypothetical protein
MNNVYDDQMAKKALSTDAARSRKNGVGLKEANPLYFQHIISTLSPRSIPLKICLGESKNFLL